MPNHGSTGEHAPVRSQLAISVPVRKVLVGVTLFFTILVAAVIGYMAAGWKLDDSIYMVIITIFGVGYGEVQPVQSPSLRLLTITVIVGGYGALIYTAGGLMQMLIDGELNKALGARRMTREIDKLNEHTIICGMGRMGTILARELKQSDKAFVVIDSDPTRLQIAEDLGYLTVIGDATEEHILELAGIRRAGVLATVLSEDAVNVFVTLTAREANPDVLIIARGENPRTEKKLIGCGANKVVLPTAIGATKLAHMIIRPTAENILDQLTTQSNLSEDLGSIGLQFHEIRLTAGASLVRKRFSEIERRSGGGFLIIGLRHADDRTVINPPEDTMLSVDDVVIVLGRQSEVPQLKTKLQAKPTKITYRGVTMEES